MPFQRYVDIKLSALVLNYLGRVALLQGGIVYRALLLLLVVILLRLVRAWLLGLSTLGHDPLVTLLFYRKALWLYQSP